MSEALSPIILAVIASTGFWTFLVTIYNGRKGKKSIEKEALLALLHDKLYYLLQKHIIMGYKTLEDLENVLYLYKPYIALGGNGTCKRLFEEFDKLPIKEMEVSE